MKTNPTRATIVRAAVLCAALACAAAPIQASAWPWGNEKVEGSGNVRQKARQVEQFHGVRMEMDGNLEVRTGNSESVVIETDDNLEPLIETVVENGVLSIRPTKRKLNLRARTMKIVVTTRQLDSLSLAGSGSINADKMQGGRLKLELGGSGKVNVQEIKGDSLAVSMGGSGSLVAGGGRSDKLSISIGGSGSVDLSKVATLDTSISIGGSGNVKVWAKETLRSSIAGSGNVSYYGDPKLSNSVAGSGATRRLGSEP